MTWRDQLLAVPMRRMGIVAPQNRLGRVLTEVADAGVFDPDVGDGREVPTDAVSLEQGAASATKTGACAVLPGWLASRDVVALNERIAPCGGVLIELPLRRGATPPTASAPNRRGSAMRPLVATYATVSYRDIDPTLFAGLTYMVMFGMMFGDVAHGAALVAIGVVVAKGTSDRLAAIRSAAPFLLGAGLAAVAFGFLYGEAFGPTGLVPTLWLRPLEEPETLLVAGLVVGSCLLAVTFLVGSVDRWRESGAAGALYDAAGIGGSLLFFGAAAVIVSIALHGASWLRPVGVGVAVVGTALTFIGLVANAGASPAGVLQALIELFDTVLRLGSNVVSFTRLAAFGLTHAVISQVVWDGTVALWNGSGLLGIVAGSLLFAGGTIAAFALSGLVAAIQALRLEYYELFSRMFVTQGRPFRPWHIPNEAPETP